MKDDFFTGLDDALSFARAMAKQGEEVQAERAMQYPTRGTAGSIPQRPAKPVFASGSSKPSATDVVRPVKSMGLPGSEKVELLTPAVTKRLLELVPPKPPVKAKATKVEIVTEDDGSKKYLKDSDKKAQIGMEDLEWPTARHLALLADRNFDYFPRRLNWLCDKEYSEKKTDAVGYATYRLLIKGHKYAGAQLPPVKSNPYDDKHFNRENINTLIAKLSVGVDEAILYPKSPGYKLEPLPIIPHRWIVESAAKVKNYSAEDYEKFRYEELVRIINDPTHPREQAWDSNDETKKGVLPDEGQALTTLYKDLRVAHAFTVKDKNGKPNVAFSPHFVILRPMVEGTKRADGRITEYLFNNDACRVESDTYTPEDYQSLLHEIYYSGMFGRLHEFTNEQTIKWALTDAWNWLIDGGYIPRTTDKYGDPIRAGHPECFLQIHPLALPLNNMGKGTDAYDDDMVRRARTHADG